MDGRILFIKARLYQLSCIFRWESLVTIILLGKKVILIKDDHYFISVRNPKILDPGWIPRKLQAGNGALSAV